MTTTPTSIKTVKLLGGPLHGQARDLPRGAEQYKVGSFWTYQYAGKIDGATVFAIRARTRRERRAISAYIKAKGEHPRVSRLFRSKDRP